MTHNVYKAWTGLYSTFVSPIKNTQFINKGQLTPEEFVSAGDALVKACPGWKWHGCEKGQENIHKQMPTDKRYLVLTGALCSERASALANDCGGEEMVDDEWTSTHIGHKVKTAGDDAIPDMEDDEPAAPAEADAIPDMDDDDDDDDDAAAAADDEDPSAVPPPEGSENVRRYDLHLLYDNYHYTPRVYLKGYNYKGELLSNQEMHQDIYAEYADKTATIEAHPYTNANMFSIHPCRHAETMKRMIDRMKDAHEDRVASEGLKGKDAEFGVSTDIALFLFLKFISSVIPTIEYDFTTGFDVA